MFSVIDHIFACFRKHEKKYWWILLGKVGLEAAVAAVFVILYQQLFGG